MSFPIPDDIRAEIERRLDAIEREEGVAILYACESGSRAWGFASTDSDYDVRFIYVRPRAHYLRIDLERQRDVVERPIDGVFDVNGWDLQKALRLFAKTNPPLHEWLDSPIVYREPTALASHLRAMATTAYAPLRARYHYLKMARNNDREFLRGATVKWKKYFYVLRPLLAVRWLEAGLGPVPTPFRTLVERTVDDDAVTNAIDDLLAKKQAGLESDVGPRIDVLSDFIAAEFTRADDAPALPSPPADLDALNALFRETLDEAG